MRKTQYVNTELLEKYLAECGYRIGYIVDKLGISRQAFDKKRKGVIAFRASEVYVLCDICKISDEDQPKIFYLAG